ncbi:hypothetical protein [Halorubrum aethiopicum]|uniref:hypothetical protein n=1 Tax=Halorubrum aethiopicum TaxID=1758255 RepID=UPI000AB688E3|nr:hypothetical protein [Halorubrum aethiopicum]
MATQKQKPTADGVEQAQERMDAAQEPTVGTDDVGAKLADAVRDGADGIGMTEFTEPSAAAAHGHSPDKGEGSHDLRGAFNVDEDFIREHFDGGVVPNGHEAVHYMLAHKESFIESDTPIFTDVADDDAARWNAIQKTAGGAPIPPARRAALDCINH